MIHVLVLVIVWLASGLVTGAIIGEDRLSYYAARLCVILLGPITGIAIIAYWVIGLILGSILVLVVEVVLPVICFALPNPKHKS